MKSDQKTEIVFDESKGYRRIRFFGSITIETVLDAIEQVINSSEYKPNTPGIYDITKADISVIDVELTKELANRIAKLTKGKIGRPKIALLSEKDLNISMIQLLKEFYDDGVTNLKTFDSLTDAENWFAG